MATTNFIPSVLRTLSRDGWLLFVTRFARLFAYGSLSVILVFYLVGLGLTEAQVGLVLTLTLVGDVVVSLYLTTRADRIGRRRMLVVGSILMTAAGLAFACTSNLLFLVIAGTIGVISPSGNEVGPFLSIEQAALSHIVPAAARTEVFAWYTLAGSLATALGALFGGGLTQALQHTSMSHVQSYRAVVFLYAALGVALALLFLRLSKSVEASPVSNDPVRSSSVAHMFGIARSRNVVLKLSGLFALDSFAGGFVVQSFAAYWFYLRFGVQPAALGAIYKDDQFAALFPRRGQPAEAPGRLALATVLQYVEGLSDRQAADAVRGRIDWKYALGLSLTDPGFDHTVLSEFRSRLVEGKAERLLLDTLLKCLQERDLIKARGRQRTDSTHVLADVRGLNRLERVGETLRAAL